MSKTIKDWEAIFAEYKVSNLSQKAFCQDQGLSWNQFRYQWDRKNPKKVEGNSLILESPPAKISFEAISLIPSCKPKEVMTINKASIYLPNQVRCDIKLNLFLNK